MSNLLFYLKNMKLFLRRHKLFSIVIVCLVILIPLLVSAVGSMGEGYKILPGNGADYCESNIRVPLSTGMYDPLFRRICNKGTKAYFVPTKTWGEWTSFYNVVAPQVLEDLTMMTYCGDGVCQQGENCYASVCCSDCTASAAYCHGNGICVTGELPVGTGSCEFQSTDCKWCSSNDYAANYSRITGGSLIGFGSACYSAQNAVAACSSPTAWPPVITNGYYLCSGAGCTGTCSLR